MHWFRSLIGIAGWDMRTLATRRDHSGQRTMGRVGTEESDGLYAGRNRDKRDKTSARERSGHPRYGEAKRLNGKAVKAHQRT